jgi:hypothetical protein
MEFFRDLGQPRITHRLKSHHLVKYSRGPMLLQLSLLFPWYKVFKQFTLNDVHFFVAIFDVLC